MNARRRHGQRAGQMHDRLSLTWRFQARDETHQPMWPRPLAAACLLRRRTCCKEARQANREAVAGHLQTDFVPCEAINSTAGHDEGIGKEKERSDGRDEEKESERSAKKLSRLHGGGT